MYLLPEMSDILSGWALVSPDFRTKKRKNTEAELNLRGIKKNALCAVEYEL